MERRSALIPSYIEQSHMIMLLEFFVAKVYASLRIFIFKLDVFGLTSAGFEILSTLAGAVGKEAGVVGGSAAKSTKTH